MHARAEGAAGVAGGAACTARAAGEAGDAACTERAAGAVNTAGVACFLGQHE